MYIKAIFTVNPSINAVKSIFVLFDIKYDERNPNYIKIKKVASMNSV